VDGQKSAVLGAESGRQVANTFFKVIFIRCLQACKVSVILHAPVSRAAMRDGLFVVHRTKEHADGPRI
jgi:hypothetical protein